MWDRISIIVPTAVVGIVLILHIVTRIIAGKHGVLCARFPAGRPVFWLLALCAGVTIYLCVSEFLTYREHISYIGEMETRGIEAVAEHENTTTEELLTGATLIGENSYAEIYVEREIERYNSIAADYKERSTDLTFLSVGFLAALSTTVIYLTKDGVMFWCVFKPQRFTVRVRGKFLRFSMEKSPQKAFIRLFGSRKNKRRFSEFISPEDEW